VSDARRMGLLRSAVLLTATVCSAEPLAFGLVHANVWLPSPVVSTASQELSQADAALQAGEADKTLALLASGPSTGEDAARVHNLLCRVRLMLEQWEPAVEECRQAVRLDGQESDYHLWLARALGEKAANASFMTAFSLAKQSRAEFEESVRLNPRNAAALSDLGDFYRQAPGIVGGGIDKATQVSSQLDKVDPVEAHQLRARIAEDQKDYATAEREFKQPLTVSPHPALAYTGLASFYKRQKRYDDMESTLRAVLGAPVRDKNAAVAFYDGAGVLIEAKRAPDLAATLLSDYLASANKKEEAPAFVAHLRLARLKAKMGDGAGAERERTAALAMAREYKPAQDFNLSDSVHQESKR